VAKTGAKLIHMPASCMLFLLLGWLLAGPDASHIQSPQFAPRSDDKPSLLQQSQYGRAMANMTNRWLHFDNIHQPITKAGVEPS
jgi:hypothetical protein